MQKSNYVLQDKIILIAGNADCIQHGIIKSFLSEGATVIFPSVSLKNISDLKKQVAAIPTGTLITQLTDVPDFNKAQEFTQIIMEKFGHIDIAVSTLACTDNTDRLSEVTMEAWQKMVDTDISLFFIFARVALPLLKKRPDALFVSVCNSQIYEWQKQTGLATLAEIAQTSMSRIFSEEAKENHTRYYHLKVQYGHLEKEFAELEHLGLINNPSLIGDHIIRLYTQKTPSQTKDVFQYFPMVHSF